MTTENTAPAAPVAPTAPGAAPVGAPAAPAAPPVAPPAGFTAPEAPAAPPAPPADAGPAPVAYEPTGNSGLDLALDFVGGLGFGPDHASLVAAAAGDWSKLEADLKALGDKAKGWERMLAVGKDAYTAVAAKQKEDAAALAGKIGAVTDGQWERVQAWAKENADPAERDAVNAAIAAGGIAAVAMAKYLHGLWAKTPGYTKDAKAATVPDASRAPVGSDALSPAEYTKEVQALARQGKVFAGSPDYARLQARRQAWRA